MANQNLEVELIKSTAAYRRALKQLAVFFKRAAQTRFARP